MSTIKLPFKTTVLLIQFGALVTTELAKALARDSEGGRKITKSEWEEIALSLWTWLQEQDLAGDK